MQGRLLLLISRRLHFSTSQRSSIRRLSVSLTESHNTERHIQQSYKQNPSQNFRSRPESEPHPNPNPNPNHQPNIEPSAENFTPKLELQPKPNPNLVTDTSPSFNASLPEFENCIWAVERLSKGKKYTNLDLKHGRVPGFVYDQDSPTTQHVLIVMDKFQMQTLLSIWSQERFLCTVFTLEVFDGFGSNNVLYRERVVPRRINFDPSGGISNIGYARAPPGMKMRLDVPIRIKGEDDCTGVRKGGFLVRYLSYVSVFCLPEELPPYVEIHVNGMDIGDKIHLGDLRIEVSLHSNNQPSLLICEIIETLT